MRRALGNISAMALKELRSLLADPVLMLLLVYSFTYAVYEVARNARMEVVDAAIAIVDQDRSEISRRIFDAFLPPYFKPARMLDAADVDAALDAGDFVFVVEIPSEFERDLIAGREPEMQINVDATAMSMAGNGLVYAQNIILGEVADFLGLRLGGDQSAVRLSVRTAFNPNLDSTWFMAVMQLIENVNILAIVLTGAALIREREHGTIEHLLAMPVAPFEIMLAKIIANGGAIILGVLVSMEVVVKGFLGVPIAGSVGLFAVGLSMYLFAMTSLGILTATLARTMPQLGFLAIPIFVVMNLLSGSMTPRESMPPWLQAAMLISPSTHFVKFAQAVLFRGAGADIVWPQMVGILATGAVFFAAALARFRRALAAG
jgi:ABC-2 type transport system permease protein